MLADGGPLFLQEVAVLKLVNWDSLSTTLLVLLFCSRTTLYCSVVLRLQRTMEPEKKRAKKQQEGGATNDAVGGDGGHDKKGVNASRLSPSRGASKDFAVVVGLEDFPDGILRLVMSFVGSYMEDCQSLVTQRVTSRRLRNVAEQELEASVLNQNTSFNNYYNFIFSPDYGFRLRRPILGLEWSEKYSTREKVAKMALKKASFCNNFLQEVSMPKDVFKAALSHLLESGAEQIQIGDYRSSERNRTCGCDKCHPKAAIIDDDDWTYGWRIRATCKPISAEHAREIIGEICEMDSSCECEHEAMQQRERYIESHLERRQRSQHFVVADPTSAGRRTKCSDARRSSALLAVAESSSIVHACISIKGHKGCKIAIRSEDVIFFHTQTCKQQVAFYYGDFGGGGKYLDE